MGTPDFAVPSLKFIEKNYNIVAVYSQPARPSGRGMRTKLSPVEKTAKELNLKTITPSTLKQDDVFLQFEKLNPDLVVVVAYGLLLPEKFLLSPKFGCINGPLMQPNLGDSKNFSGRSKPYATTTTKSGFSFSN